ncbi:MAG: CHASE domain-containing protein [Betaproteobacteria bacterium]|nr:CHASE domain-containing protein [Betaproteobacteria bacterium]
MYTIKRASLLHPWPLAMAALGVLVTLISGFASSRWMDDHVGDEFSYEAERIAATIQQRFDTYQEALRGLQGLFVSTQDVSRAEFRAYVNLLRLAERHPGAQEFWFARHVSAAGRSGYEARVRRELAALGEADSFAIQPAGERDEYLAVEYVHPLAENRRFLGSDLLTVPERKNAIARTRKTHQLVLSGRLSGMNGASHYALIAAIPPHGGQEFPGTVSMVFRPAEVVGTVVQQQNLAGLNLEIYDSAEAAAQGDKTRQVVGGGENSAAQLTRAGSPARYQRTLPLKIGDREWALAVTSMPEYTTAAAEMWLPPILVAGGCIVTLLFYFLAAFMVAARQRAEGQFAETFDFIPDGLLIVNEAGRILRANSPAETMFGYGRGELIGQPLGILLPEDKQTKHASLSLEFFAHPSRRPMGARGVEISGRARDGRVFPAEVELAPLETKDGTVVITDIRDVSGRVEAERALEATNQELLRERGELARRVSERTAELATVNETLRQEMQTKQDFLATMSHEIRTPLTGLLGMLELLSFSTLTDEQRHELVIARESGKSLARIIDDVLDFSKIEAGKLQLSLQPENLRQLAEAVRNAHLSVASAKGISLMSFVDPRIHPVLMMDGMRVKQILQNFLSNAIKFTAEGYAEIRAELIAQTDDSSTVRLTVRDTGIGLAPEAQMRLFERYTQADSGVARRYGGTGLGLCICKKLVGLMGGEIAVKSKLGEGSAFSVTLTFRVAETGEAAVTAPHGAMEAVYRLDSGGFPVLAVDDHPINRTLLARQLGLLGLPVELAENGNQALAKWKNGNYCLILTDCHMPSMDGYDLARAVREIESREGRTHIPIIAWTAAALSNEVERCHAAGMDDVLLKPSELGVLRQTLARWLPFSPANGRSSSAPVVLDQAVLTALTDSAEDEVSILRDFVAQTHRDLAALEAALTANDLAAAAREAHRIKGASRMVGAFALAQRSGRLAQAAHGGNAPEACRWLAEMQVDFAALQARFPALSGASSNNTKTGEAAQADSALPVWDAQVLTDVIGNNPLLRDELLDSFFESSKTTVMEIRAAYEKRESKLLARAAYKLNPVAAAVGALDLAAAGTALEQVANNNDWLDTSTAYDHLQDAYRRFAALHGIKLPCAPHFPPPPVKPPVLLKQNFGANV